MKRKKKMKNEENKGKRMKTRRQENKGNSKANERKMKTRMVVED